MRLSLAFALVALGVVASTACTVHETPCSPGDYVYCACPNAPHGYSICTSDGAGYGACDCSGVLPPGVLTDAAVDAADDAATDAPDGAADTAPPGADFGGTCTNNSDCKAGLECYPFTAKGPHCSKKCSSNTDCPTPPGLGCSGMGECKIP